MNNKPSSKKTVIIVGLLFCICCCIISIFSGGGIFFMTRKKDKKKDENDPSPSPDTKAEGNMSYFTEGVDYTIKGSRENPTRYCSSDPGTGMICDRTVLGDWEKFQFKHVDGNVYGIKSNRTGKYCKDNRTGSMTCDHNLNEHEKLIIEKHGDKYSIKGPWGDKYCSDQPEGLICDTGPLQDWEKFTIKKIN